MRFTEHPLPRPPPDETVDEPGVMHIGRRRGRRLRAAAGWVAAVLAAGGVLVGFFVWFGATAGWAVALVALMLAYMALMAKWADGDGR